MLDKYIQVTQGFDATTREPKQYSWLQCGPGRYDAYPKKAYYTLFAHWVWRLTGLQLVGSRVDYFIARFRY